MVLIHLKRSDKNEFLYKTTTTTSNDSLIRELCFINNTRIRLLALADALPSLAKHGVAKEPNKQGLDEYEENAASIVRGEFYEADPLGLRTGEGVGPQLSSTLDIVAEDARTYVSSKNQISMKICMDRDLLQEKLMNMRGAVMMAFPMGLPTYDPVKLLLDEENVEVSLAGSSWSLDVTAEDSAELWWAGKQFFRHQVVGDLVGKNEKTKIIAKLQKKGGGVPCREPGVSEQERKAMMAFYFKKQEEMKKLSEDDQEEYMTASWADPDSLKNSLRGTNRIRPF